MKDREPQNGVDQIAKLWVDTNSDIKLLTRMLKQVRRFRTADSNGSERIFVKICVEQVQQLKPKKRGK